MGCGYFWAQLENYDNMWVEHRSFAEWDELSTSTELDDTVEGPQNKTSWSLGSSEQSQQKRNKLPIRAHKTTANSYSRRMTSHQPSKVEGGIQALKRVSRWSVERMRHCGTPVAVGFLRQHLQKRSNTPQGTHLETPRRETMKWDEMKIHVSSCWVFGFAQLPYWDYCRYTRLIRPCIPLQGIASLHWVCQGVPNAPARWYTNSKRTIETHVLHAWRCTDVSDWNLYATWTSSR